MKIKIIYSGRYEDSIIIEGETLKEIRAKTDREIRKRKWETENCWSEIIEENEQ